MSQKDTDKRFKKVKINYHFPEDLNTYFVENIIAQHQPGFFILSFFETFLPPIVGETPEDREKALEKLKEVDAKCVARLVVTPEKMNDIIEVLIENFDAYRQKISKKPEATEATKE